MAQNIFLPPKVANHFSLLMLKRFGNCWPLFELLTCRLCEFTHGLKVVKRCTPHRFELGDTNPSRKVAGRRVDKRPTFSGIALQNLPG